MKLYLMVFDLLIVIHHFFLKKNNYHENKLYCDKNNAMLHGFLQVHLALFPFQVIFICAFKHT